jgi:NAD(P)H dehydrogenase (quinone)
MEHTKVLIITAHPSSQGFTHKIAAAFAEGARKVGKDVEIIDLYKTNLKQDFFTFEEKSDMVKADPIRTAIQSKIRDASELVFIHPLWWMGMPAIMKNFIDINVASQFAFRYVKGWPVGLLKGKKGHVFITCDGRMWLYWLMAMPFRIIWNFGILRFCGVKPVTFKVLSEKYKRSEEYLNIFLEMVRRRGER